MTSNSLNYNTLDTKSAMKMPEPIWNDFFPLFPNISILLILLKIIVIDFNKNISNEFNKEPIPIIKPRIARITLLIIKINTTKRS